MKVVISGSSGLVGRWLVPHLEAADHQVVRLVRGEVRPGTAGVATWDPARGGLDAGVLAGADAVINLNGRTIGDGRWTARLKEELRSSRIRSTETLARAIATVATPPPLLINASAVGYYGDRGEEVLDEGSPAGTGFLAELARDWERAALAAASGRTRVVLLRLAMVVGRGGALERMLLPFRLGAGGPLGSGRQWMPWVHIDDLVGILLHAGRSESLRGPINGVAPAPVTNATFTLALARAVRRPAVLPMPAFALNVAFGEMSGMLMASQRVMPALALRSGYAFSHPDLDGALASLLAPDARRDAA